MSELYDFINTETNTVFSKPEFPTRRWGQVHLKESTTDKVALDKAIAKYAEIGVKTRRRLDKINTEKFKNLGNFYFIEKYVKKEKS